MYLYFLSLLYIIALNFHSFFILEIRKVESGKLSDSQL